MGTNLRQEKWVDWSIGIIERYNQSNGSMISPLDIQAPNTQVACHNASMPAAQWHHKT